ncbi:MAG: PRC-barrel domain-containing protein [Pseudomonadota bacterium]
MKNLLVSTALVALMAGPAFAGSTAAKTETDGAAMENASAPVIGGESRRVSDFIGRYVYVGETSTEEAMAEADAEWENIGEVNDVILTRDGEIDGVLVDVGGFLGMGEHTVKVTMDTLKLVQDADDRDDFFLVSTTSREALEAMPEYQEAEAAERGDERYSTYAAAEGETGKAEAAATEEVEENEPRWVEIDSDALRIEQIQNASVYGPNGEAIGEVETLTLASGSLDKAIVDVGGFLGLGEKPVAISFDELTFMQEEDGDEIRVMIDKTQQALEEMPTFEYDS